MCAFVMAEIDMKNLNLIALFEYEKKESLRKS